MRGIAQLLTSSFQHLPSSLGAIRQCQIDDLVVSGIFDLSLVRSQALILSGRRDLTFSRTTSGPLTPPTVLYLIRGVTEYDDDSRGSAMVGSSAAPRQRALQAANRVQRKWLELRCEGFWRFG